MFDEDVVLDADSDEKQIGESHLNVLVAEAKGNPHDARYWGNPSVDLIGIQIKKRFGIQ